MVEVVTIRDGQLVINRTEVLSVKELKKIATRKIGMPGDHDGRKKLRNLLELQFVKYFAETRLHSTSIYAGMSDKVKTQKIKEDIGLPDDWTPDEHVKAAIEKYAEILNDYIPSARVLNSFEKGLTLIADSNLAVMKRLQGYVEKLNEFEENIISEEGEIDLGTVEALNIATQSVQKCIGDFVKLSKDLPAMLDTINKLRDTVRKEEGGVARKRGGKEIGNREIPK